MDVRAISPAGTTVHSLFQRAFRLFRDNTAVTSPTGSWTYGEIGDHSRRLAAGLVDRGIRRGDRVAVLAETRPEYVEAYAALASMGVTLLTLNIRMHPEELAWCVETGRPKALLVSGRFVGMVPDLIAAAPDELLVISMDGADEGIESYATVLESARATSWESPQADDIHVVLYTSGTTGRPKGAMISQQAAAVRGLRLAQWFGLTAEDGFIGWLPMYHCGGDESLYATFLTGGTFATLPFADAESLYAAIQRDRLTWTLLLPGVITDFLDHPRRSDFDLSTLRFAIGYANMMPGIVTRLTRGLDINFYDAFGQTETSYLVAHGIIGPGDEPTFAKLASPLMEIRLVDAEMNDVPDGTPGECVVRGPSVMSGYLDDEEATRDVFRGGWLHTGDVLVGDEQGRLTFVDRTKFLIKTGGENVYPAEVEAALSSHPDVAEACVFGVSDEHWGETVKAAVVLRAAAQPDRGALDTWCRERLAGYKRPRYIEFMATGEVPRSTTGKVMRHVLAKASVTSEQAV